MKKCLFLILIISRVYSQSLIYDFKIELISVEKLSITNDGYDYKVITEIDTFHREGAIAGYEFQDDLLIWGCFVSSSGIFLTIENYTDQLTKIFWEEVVYIDEYLKKRKIVHRGVEHPDINNNQPPTIIEPNGWIVEYLAPIDNIFFLGKDDVIEDDWSSDPMFPNEVYTRQNFEEQVLGRLGKRVKLFLPIMVGVTKYEYTFIHQIVDYKIAQDD